MLRVTVPPQPIVTPAEVPGDHDMNDARIMAMIAAVTAEIDGPIGWLGRALGTQTLELRLETWPCGQLRLPCPPVIAITSVKHFDADDVEQTIDAAHYGVSAGVLWFKSSWSRPALGCQPFPVTILYTAGYNGTSISAGGTGSVPAQVKQAIVLSVQHMMSIARDDLFLKVDEVDSVGRKEWTVSEQAGNIIRSTADRLLQGLRVFG